MGPRGAGARLRRRLARRGATAAALEARGRLDEALDRARADGDRAAVARVEGRIRSLDPAWRPRATLGRPPEPVAGRVLNLLESSLPHVTAGYAQRSRTLCAAQVEAGLEPVVATRLGFPASRGIAFEPVEHVDGVAHHRFWIDGLRHYTAVPRDRQVEHNVRAAATLAAEVRPALIWAATPHLNGLVGIALRDWLGVPLIYDVRGFPDLTWRTEHDAPADAEHATRLRAAESRCIREADAVVTLSETMRREVVARGADPDRVTVLPHAVAPALAGGEESGGAGLASAASALRRRLGLADSVVVGHASTLRSYEGADVLLRALAEVRAAHADLACLIVGDGPARKGLERLATRLGLRRAVAFSGRVPESEMPAHYAACDVLAVPRLAVPVCESVTPLKVFEAMAAGRAVVASDLPPLAEATAGAARLTAPGDAHALARALRSLAGDRDERERLGRRARAAAARAGADRLAGAVAGLAARLHVDTATAGVAR
jgi:glycosyltransferase involved in cell wall biosynthesis